MTKRAEPSLVPTPQSLLGTWRRFGVNGPAYEIVGISQSIDIMGQMMRIKVIETGEELDYRISEILDDPRER